MKTFEIKLSSGKIVEVDAPDAQTAAKVAARYEASQRPGYQRALKDARRKYTADEPGRTRRDGSMTPLLQGALYGWADEAVGRVDQLGAMTGNLARRVRGEPIPYTSEEAYQASTEAFREQEQAFSERHPGHAAGQTLVGGAMGPGVAASGRFVARAPNLVGAMTRGAGVGAVYGGVAGAGSAEGGFVERAAGAGRGAVVGGVTGGATPAVARGVAALPSVARRAGSAAVATVDAVRNPAPAGRLPTPQATGRAERYVRDMAGRARVDAAAARANPAYAAGKPVTGAEILGREGVSQMTALGRRPGQTADVLDATLSERATGAPERVLEGLESASRVDAASLGDDFAAQAARLREQAAPLYDEAYAAGPLSSPKLDVLVGRPSMRRALSRAARIAAEEGRDPTEVGFRVVQRGAGTSSRDAAVTTAGPDGRFQVVGSKTVEDPLLADLAVQVENPTTQTWDYVKRGLDDILEGYRDKTTGRLVLDEEGRAIVSTLKQLRGELTSLNPAYARALDAGGEPLRLEEAYRLAPRLMSPGVSERTFRQRWDGFSDAQRTALRQGAVNSLYESFRNGRLKLKEMQTPSFRTKLETLVGPEEAGRFLESVRLESQLAKTGARMAPGTNSVTSDVIIASQAQDQALSGAGQIATGAVTGNWGGMLRGAGRVMTAPLRGAQAPIDEMTRDEVGRILIDPEELIRVLEAQGIRVPRMTVSPYAVPAVSGLAARQ